MDLSRRQALRTLASLPLAGALARTAAAQVTAQSPALARYVLINRATRPSPADTFHSFGMAFVAGDIPRGSVAALLSEDGREVAIQGDMRATWPDGSLRWGEISLRDTALGPSGERRYAIETRPGSWPQQEPHSLSSIRDRSDLSLALSDLRDAEGQLQGAGRFVFRVNDALADPARCTLTATGPVCSEWRVWDHLRAQGSAAPHPHLIGLAYLRVWRTSDGSPGPISACLALSQGWLGVPDPTRYDYEALLRDGSREMRRFTRRAPIRDIQSDGRIRVPDHGFATADAVMLEAADQPAQGLLYFVHRLDGDMLTLHRSGNDAEQDTDPVRLTELGRAATLVRRISHPHHSAWFALGADARPDWLLGERAELHGLHDTAYLRRTGMLPPYDLAQKVDQSREVPRRGYDPSPVYHPFGVASARTETDAPGEHPQIGLLPGWCAVAFLGQSAAEAERARINAIAAAGYPNRFFDEASLGTTGMPRIPMVLATPIAGMGPPRPDSFFYSSAGHSPEIATPQGGDGPWLPGDTSHYPSPIYYTLLTEGGRHLMDLEIAWASHVLFNREAGERNRSVDRLYRGVVMCNAYNIRADGWAMRELSYAAAIIPDGEAERAYFRAALVENLDFAMAVIDAAPPEFRAGGHWSFKSEAVESPWMQGFVMQGMTMVAMQHPDLPQAHRFLSHHQTQIRAFADPCPMRGTAYRFLFRDRSTGDGRYLRPEEFAYLLSGAAQLRFLPDGTRVAIDSSPWPLGDGDRLRLTTVDQDWQALPALPPGLADRLLHVVGMDGTRFSLAENAGGPPLRWDPAAAPATPTYAWWIPRGCAPLQDISHDPQGYYQVLRATLACAAWAGLPGFAALHARLTAANGTDLSGNPKYAYAP